MTRAREIAKLNRNISSSLITGAIPDSLLTGVDSDLVQPLIPHSYIQDREADTEVAEWSIGNNNNKTVDTWYDFDTTLSPGTWLPIYRGYLWIFENHGNSNSTGVYMEVIYLGSSFRGEQYGNGYLVQPKWGNASNSYGSTFSTVFPKFTLTSNSTIYSSWRCNEYGGSSNYWVRMGGRGWSFMRLA